MVLYILDHAQLWSIFQPRLIFLVNARKYLCFDQNITLYTYDQNK